MNINSNAYTFIFSIVMVVVVAAALAFTATSLSEKQGINRTAEKMQDILKTVGIDSVEVDGKKEFLSRDLAEESYKKYIVEELALKNDGTVDEDVNPFEDIDLGDELKKPVDEQRFPLYIAEVDGDKYYIVPLYGSGLWDAIWGYISLEDDVNTVKGANFDHKGETAGLGAEITKDWFQDSFKEEKILDDGNLVGVEVVMGYTGGNDKDDHQVDGISGSTLTSNGVTNMIQERLKHYVPYFNENTDVEIKYTSN